MVHVKSDPDTGIDSIYSIIAAKNAILFDGDCIYCSDFTKVMSMRSVLGELKLINLRDHPDLNKLLRMNDMDPNEGMVFKYGDELYFGAEAVHMLAILNRSTGFWGVVSRVFFRRPKVVKLLYPLMKAGRRVTLFVRNRKMID